MSYYVINWDITLFVRAAEANSVEELAMGWTTEGSALSPCEFNNFHFSISSRPALESHPASYPMEMGGLLPPGIKCLGH
jgi:hypothetical protein